MEEENQDATSEINGIMRYHRDIAPSQHLLLIKSYSVLAASKLKRLESDVFEACGNNWKMIVYLRGHSEANKDKHISLYLAIAERKNEELPVGWEVWAKFKLFVHDQINNKYLVFQDAQNKLKRFCSSKTEWGFDEFLSMDSFKDANNGYLVNDSCTFGAEVLVSKYYGKRECVSTILKPPSYGTYTWSIEKFSRIKEDFCYSNSFTAGGIKWKLKVYPKGDKGGRNGFVSIFLVLDEMELGKKWYAEFTLRIKDPKSSFGSGNPYSSSDRVYKGEGWFSDRHNYWGLSESMPVEEFKRYCVRDTVNIECKISLIIQAQLYED
ncbi:hypothetical protein K1719_026098 [Acacia pycnantha]|nr:hypothetical protein K1719_026098 [Acacia pycnantha]